MPMTFDKSYFLRLFLTLTWTNFKMRYYGSILGYVWSLLKPLAMFGVLYAVFTVVMKQNAPHYKLFLCLESLYGIFLSKEPMPE